MTDLVADGSILILIRPFWMPGITESEAPASAEVSSGESEGASEGVGEDNSGEGGSGGEDDGLGE